MLILINLIEVYKTFKNTAPAYIEIITEGGTIGLSKHVFEPTLELEIGQLGVFTLNPNNQTSQFGKLVYESYASAQGFIKYDVKNNTASEPFNQYQNISHRFSLCCFESKHFAQKEIIERWFSNSKLLA